MKESPVYDKRTLEAEMVNISASCYSKLDYYERNLLQLYYNKIHRKNYRIDKDCIEEILPLLPKLRKKLNVALTHKELPLHNEQKEQKTHKGKQNKTKVGTQVPREGDGLSE